MYDLTLVAVGVLGVLVGLALGLTYAFAVTWQLSKLGQRMGTQVLQASRLAAHVSREYAPLREQVDELRRQVEALRRFWTGEGG